LHFFSAPKNVRSYSACIIAHASVYPEFSYALSTSPRLPFLSGFLMGQDSFIQFSCYSKKFWHRLFCWVTVCL